MRKTQEIDADIQGEINASPLGKVSATSDRYNPNLLFRLHRAPNRERIGIELDTRLPFMGADVWTAYELSWLTPRGKPQVALATLTVPCETPCMVESKSLKLYLNSFHNTCIADVEDLKATIRKDLTAAVWDGGVSNASVGIQITLPADFARQRIAEPEGVDLDRMDLDCDPDARPDAQLLNADHGLPDVTESLVSNLLKSNCPVTNQPDWGSVCVQYSGPAIDQAALLRYIVSFRHHQDFHEHCCERMFTDILQQCKPTKLAVYTRYTRRGGLDINPYRTSHPQAMPANVRNARQ